MSSIEKMLINATQLEEIRVALIRNNVLIDLDIECPAQAKNKGNIYKACITRIEPSLGAVFVDYGSKRQGFLPFKEIAQEYLINTRNPDESTEGKPVGSLLREGQELLIQVDKEERGNKGAAVTTLITLAGAYLVLMPNNPRSGGISRRIEGDDRDELRETLNALQLPEDMGLIIRTAGVGKNQEDLQEDLNKLCNQWQAIKQAYQTEMAPCLIHQEGDVIIRSIRDNLRKSIAEIIIDDHVSYIKAKQYIEQVKPEFLPNLKLYKNTIPLFNFYQVESQIETAYQREVLLPSGGVLVIDRTEALVSIDINSAKATSGSDIESTALNTNMEAAEEIARQLRLRDLAGLVVIDFIDMSSSKNQRDVENKLKDALQADKARIQVGRISRFGLLEMSRQRLRLSLGESAQEVCPACAGRGTVRNIQSHALSITRLIEEEAIKDRVAEIQVQLPTDMATFIMNEKRDFIRDIEKRHGVHIIIIANPYMKRPQYSIVRVNEENIGKNKKPSYSLVQQPDIELIRDDREALTLHEPAVKTLANATQTKKEDTGFIKHLWNILFGSKSNEPATSGPTVSAPEKPVARTQNDRRNSNNPNRKRRPSGGMQQQQTRNANTQTSTNPNQRKRNSSQHSGNQNRKISPLPKKRESEKKDASGVKETSEKS